MSTLAQHRADLETPFQRLFREARPYAEQLVAERMGAVLAGDPIAAILAGPRCPSRFNRADVVSAIRHEQHCFASTAVTRGETLEAVAERHLGRTAKPIKRRIAA